MEELKYILYYVISGSLHVSFMMVLCCVLERQTSEIKQQNDTILEIQRKTKLRNNIVNNSGTK